MGSYWDPAQLLDQKEIMNKKLIIESMTDSFKEANISLAIKSGMTEEQAKESIGLMSSSIEICMENVLDNLLKNFPEIIK